MHPQFTQHLWENRADSEKIKNILISEDGKNVVMIGNLYHYVFEDELGFIKKIYDEKEILNPKIVNNAVFFLGKDGNAETSVTIRLDCNEESQARQLFEKSGFKKVLNHKYAKNQKVPKAYLEGSIKLTGEFYRPDPKVNYDNLPSKLSKSYDVTLKYEHGLLKKIYSVPLTPITVTADILFPFFIIGLAGAVFVATPVVIVGLCAAGRCKVSYSEPYKTKHTDSAEKFKPKKTDGNLMVKAPSNEEIQRSLIHPSKQVKSRH